MRHASPGPHRRNWYEEFRDREQDRRKRGEAYPEVLRQARERVMAACKKAGIIFMSSGTNPDNVEEKLQQGVMITRASEATAEKGRKLTNREMPW